MTSHHHEGRPAIRAKTDELAPREVAQQAGVLAASTIRALITHAETVLKGVCYAGAKGYLGELGGKEGVLGAVEPMRDAVERLRAQLRSVSDLNENDWEMMSTSGSPLFGFLRGCEEFAAPTAFEKILGGMAPADNTDRLFLTDVIKGTFRTMCEPLDGMLGVFYEHDTALSFSSSDKGTFKDNLREALVEVVKACKNLLEQFTQPPWEIRKESRLAALASFV